MISKFEEVIIMMQRYYDDILQELNDTLNYGVKLMPDLTRAEVSSSSDVREVDVIIVGSYYVHDEKWIWYNEDIMQLCKNHMQRTLDKNGISADISEIPIFDMEIKIPRESCTSLPYFVQIFHNDFSPIKFLLPDESVIVFGIIKLGEEKRINSDDFIEDLEKLFDH